MSTNTDVNEPLRIPAHVGFTIIDGEAVILDMKRGVYFGLDEIGTALWRSVADHGTATEVVTQLEEEYEVDPAQLRRDIREWLDCACAAGLIERV